MQKQQWASVAPFEKFDFNARESDNLAFNGGRICQSILPAGPCSLFQRQLSFCNARETSGGISQLSQRLGRASPAIFAQRCDQPEGFGGTDLIISPSRAMHVVQFDELEVTFRADRDVAGGVLSVKVAERRATLLGRMRRSVTRSKLTGRYSSFLAGSLFEQISAHVSQVQIAAEKLLRPAAAVLLH
jgi:hypothetical protein